MDGLLGIGGRGGLRPAAAALAGQIPPGVPVVAVDLPSGVDADTGEVAGPAVSADVTVTFGAYKPGLLVDPGASLAGAVHLVDIGLELPPAQTQALQHADVAALLAGAHRDQRQVPAGRGRDPRRVPPVPGRGGTRRGRSPARRCGRRAVRGPRGRSRARPVPRDADRAGPGPGVGGRAGTGEGRAGEVADLLAQDVPVLVDADGLRGLDPELLRTRSAPTLLTPHAGEAAALLEVPRESVEAGRLRPRRPRWHAGTGPRCC